MEWAAKFADQTHYDFYLKSKVYVNRPQTIQAFNDSITEEIALISPKTIRNVVGKI